MLKIKITSFDKEGVRGGKSLEAALSEIDWETSQPFSGEKHPTDQRDESAPVRHDSGNASGTETSKEEVRILQICRLTFASLEKARSMGRLIRSRNWTKIVLEKTSGRFVSLVLQDSVSSTRVLEVKQHQRYDGIKWNFGLDWFPNDIDERVNGCGRPSLEEVHLTGVRFRDGDELAFLNSLSDGLEKGTTSSKITSIRCVGLKVLELNACRFLHPKVQYPILFRGLKTACFSTLERLWMPKSPGLNDDRFEELFGKILLLRDEKSSLREIGFSYNACGWKGSKAVASFLKAPQSALLKVLYLNRQQGELDLQEILQSAVVSNKHIDLDIEHQPRQLHLNLSQNYVSSLETLKRLISQCEINGKELQTEHKSHIDLHVELDSMVFEVPEVVIPGNQSNNNGKGKGNTKKNSREDHLQNLTKEEITKLNVACGRIKYVLGRAAAASDQENSLPASTQSNPSSVGTDRSNIGKENESVSFFSSSAALECVLPDLLTVLRLQDKQNASIPPETFPASDSPKEEHITPQQRQYRNWLPTFLRKAIKGKIEILKPWLLSVSKGSSNNSDGDAQIKNQSLTTVHGERPPVIATESEQDRLKTLWNDIETLHATIVYHSGQRRHKHSPGNTGETFASPNKSNRLKKKRQGRKVVAEIPMTPGENPLVRAAYDAIPTIPTSILESSNTSFISFPMNDSQEKNVTCTDSNHNNFETNVHVSPDIHPVPPIFIDTTECLLKLRDDLFRRPKPYKRPRMVAVDSEWYFLEDSFEKKDSINTSCHNNQVERSQKNKNRSMSVATLQIAYLDENTNPMILRSFVIDLLSHQSGFQEVAKECVSWLFGSASCDMMILGFAFGGDLRQLRKYAGIGGKKSDQVDAKNSTNRVASLEAVESRCLDIQLLLASREELRQGRVPGLKRCAQYYFTKPLKKDDQTSDWRERPLRQSQIEYAALDAVILLVLLSQKKQEYEA